MAGKSVQPRFASAAQGYEAKSLNVNAVVFKDPPATFVVQIDVDNMVDAGILPGSKVFVNRARASKAKSGDIVLAIIDHEFLICELQIVGKTVWLLSNNKAMDYLPIKLAEDQELIIWGVVEHGLNYYS